MAISELDYKFQGSKLKNAVIDVISRNNTLHGRYAKGGGFGLDFYSDNYKIENHRWIIERANIADEMIKEAQSVGKNIDDPEILKEIAKEVGENIKTGKGQGAYFNYIIYLVVPILVLTVIYFIFS